MVKAHVRAVRAQKSENCAVCGRPLVYFTEARPMTCALCGKTKPADAACEAGHFVCDACHAGGGSALLAMLRSSDEKDPMALLERAFRLEGTHMHGPEHHFIVPCVLLTAYHNCGGKLGLDAALAEAAKRGSRLPGGACGFLGVCGAAAGAGVFASIVSGATPLTKDRWAIPQRLTAACLEAMAAVGGPRCCKRTSRITVECAAAFSEKEFGVAMPVSKPVCAFVPRNRECIGKDCPYFPGGEG